MVDLGEYIVRIAEYKEHKEVINFYNTVWKRAQTLNDNRMFEYYYHNPADNANRAQFSSRDVINFVIGVRDDEIVGACGFIFASEKYVWLSNLAVRKGEHPGLVFRLLKYLLEMELNISAVNIVENTRGLYRRFGFQTGELKHYYRVLKSEGTKIIRFNNTERHCTDDEKLKPTDTEEVYVKELSDEKQLRDNVTSDLFLHQKPLKTVDYFLHRYYRFPFQGYRYQVWSVSGKPERTEMLVVTREQKINGISVLRIVDMVGDETLLPSFVFWEEMQLDASFEYIDLWCYGVDETILGRAGFACVSGDDVIVPDRLDPVEWINDRIFFVNGNMSDFRAYRADADNDRPNIRHKTEKGQGGNVV